MESKLPNPFRKGATRPAPPPGLTTSDWARLYVMAFVLVVVVGGMVYMSQTATPNKKKPKQGSGTTIGPSAAPAREGHRHAGHDEHGRPQISVPDEKKEVALTDLPSEGEEIDFKALAAPFKDGREAPVKETPEFIALIRTFINNVKYGELAKKVNPELTADKVYRESEMHRGAVVRIQGRIIKDYPEMLNATIPEGLDVVYFWIMQERPTGRTVSFYTTELPRDSATGELLEFTSSRASTGEELLNDWIEVEGIFLRRYDYAGQFQDHNNKDSQNGSALFFVKDFKIVIPPKTSDPRDSFAYIAIGIGVVLAGIVLVAGFMSRKYGSDSIRMKMHAVRKAKGEVSYPRPDPDKKILGDEIPPAPAPPPSGESASSSEGPEGQKEPEGSKGEGEGPAGSA